MLALDLFCGGGGATRGMQWAGFEVVGIDKKPFPNYPGEDFIIADISTGKLPVDIRKFDFVFASPPCQFASVATKCRPGLADKHPNLIPVTREMLKGHPYTCIENVPGAELEPSLTLWGPQVGLGPTEKTDGLWRKRIFETSFFILNPPTPKMERGRYISVTTTMCASSHFYRRKRQGLPGRPSIWLARHVMGIPICSKMTYREVGEAVPPPYSYFIACEVMRQINGKSVFVPPTLPRR